jgi:hypothetical protein
MKKTKTFPIPATRCAAGKEINSKATTQQLTGKKYFMKLYALIGALIVSATSAHATLGWTMDDCLNAWGTPIKVQYNAPLHKPGYIFKVQANLYTEVYLLNDQVASVTYLSKSKNFLGKNVIQLLSKNNDGTWELYADGRGKETSETWHVMNDSDGTYEAYALFWSKANSGGFYRFQVSSGLWDSYLNGLGQAQTNQDKNDLNI